MMRISFAPNIFFMAASILELKAPIAAVLLQRLLLFDDDAKCPSATNKMRSALRGEWQSERAAGSWSEVGDVCIALYGGLVEPLQDQ